MEKLLALGAVSLFIGMATVTLSGSQDRGGNCVLDGRRRAGVGLSVRAVRQVGVRVMAYGRSNEHEQRAVSSREDDR
jgi:hypothetical protein